MMDYTPLFGAVCYYEYSGDYIDFIGEAQRLGLHWIEFKYDKDLIKRGESSNTALVRRALKDADIGVSIHTPFEGIPIASVDESERRKAIDEISRSLDYAAELGAAQATIHPGQIDPQAYSDKRWAESAEANLKSLRELASYGRDRGITLCLENSNVYERKWLKHGICYGEMKMIRHKVGDHLAFTVDFGHALFYASDPSYLIRELGSDTVKMAHLHDNNGLSDSHSVLGTGILSLGSLLLKLHDDKWSFPICIEVKNTEDLQHSVQILLKAYHRIIDL